MAQSPEYPDLKWVVPRSWSNTNRTSVQVVVIHDTEGSSKASSAEDGAAYDQSRTDGTSTHYFHDNNSTVQCVRTEDIAHTARTQGNRRGIHHEMCGRASFSKATWLDPSYGLAMLQRTAKQVARDCKKWKIPATKISSSQVASGVKGICGHADITRAFPADHGTHTDPGPNFPWPEFIKMVQHELLGPTEEDDMPTVGEFWAAEFGPKDDRVTAGTMLAEAWEAAQAAQASATALSTKVTDLSTKLDKVLAIISKP